MNIRVAYDVSILSERGMQRSRQFTWKRCAYETMEEYRVAISESRRERCDI